jgi:hypothetical protein
LLPFGLFAVFPGHAWPEYVMDHEPELPCLTSSVKDNSKLMVVEEEVEPDAMVQLFMDHFEVFFMLGLCFHIYNEMLLFI